MRITALAVLAAALKASWSLRICSLPSKSSCIFCHVAGFLLSISEAICIFSTSIYFSTSVRTSKKEGVPGFRARSILGTPAGTGRPQSPITIVSVWPKSARTLAMSLLRIPIFCILQASFLHLYDTAYSLVRPASDRRGPLRRWQTVYCRLGCVLRILRRQKHC